MVLVMVCGVSSFFAGLWVGLCVFWDVGEVCSVWVCYLCWRCPLVEWKCCRSGWQVAVVCYAVCSGGLCGVGEGFLEWCLVCGAYG